MAGIDTLLVLALQNRMARDQRPILEDTHLGRVVLDFDDPAPGRIRHAVLVAANSDHAFLADPALHGQDSSVGTSWKGDEVRSLLGKVLVHDPLRDGVKGHPKGPSKTFEKGCQKSAKRTSQPPEGTE
ncbi:MAG: hypothetical protein VX974_01590 [Pseudomonadota bacterium]|nr:hypothetical protein [Pseudomonadota bacterium]